MKPRRRFTITADPRLAAARIADRFSLAELLELIAELQFEVDCRRAAALKEMP